jgi:hypothetical protein
MQTPDDAEGLRAARAEAARKRLAAALADARAMEPWAAAEIAAYLEAARAALLGRLAARSSSSATRR